MEPHAVVVLVADGMHHFEFGVASEVFGVDRSDLVDPWYQFRVAAQPVTVRSSVGVSITVDGGWNLLDEADTVIVAGWPELETPPPARLIRALQSAHDRGARLLSICSGSFALAHAGLLDGRRATTHWMFAERMAACFPAVRVDPNVLFIFDDIMGTSAGTAAGIDLCLEAVRRDHGELVAADVARRMVTPPHRSGGQAQYIDYRFDQSDSLAGLLGWLEAHLDEKHTVKSIARRANLSERTLARRFNDELGIPPHEWLTQRRLRRAQGLLEGTTLGIDEIARRCGYANRGSLRAQFSKRIQTTPARYRQAFQGSGKSSKTSAGRNRAGSPST